jgi:hypothetical protein
MIKKAEIDFESTATEIANHNSLVNDIELTDYVAQKLCDILSERIEKAESKLKHYQLSLESIAGKDYPNRELDEQNINYWISGLRADIRANTKAWNKIQDKHVSDLRQFRRRSSSRPHKHTKPPVKLIDWFITQQDYERIVQILIDERFILSDLTLRDTRKGHQRFAAGIIKTLKRKGYFKPDIRLTAAEGMKLISEAWGITMTRQTYVAGNDNEPIIPDRR